MSVQLNISERNLHVVLLILLPLRLLLSSLMTGPNKVPTIRIARNLWNGLELPAVIQLRAQKSRKCTQNGNQSASRSNAVGTPAQIHKSLLMFIQLIRDTTCIFVLMSLATGKTRECLTRSLEQSFMSSRTSMTSLGQVPTPMGILDRGTLLITILGRLRTTRRTLSIMRKTQNTGQHVDYFDNLFFIW
jgi:hypothetical protein